MRVTILGSGFVATNVANALRLRMPDAAIRVASRQTEHRVDVTDRDSLRSVLEGSDAVINTVGLLQASRKTFEAVQHEGAENVARITRENNAKLVQISAIGADTSSRLPYPRTKALGEQAALSECPDCSIVRPSLIFGPGDSFFNRFAWLAKYMPFLPVFGKGETLFQPVYVGDVAAAVALCAESRNDKRIGARVDGKITEAGGPEVFTYRQIMQLVIDYSGNKRPIVSIPWSIAKMQAFVLENLPMPPALSITRDQVEQLKNNNIVTPKHEQESNAVSFKELLGDFAHIQPSSVHEILPAYLSPEGHEMAVTMDHKTREEERRKKRLMLRDKKSY